jgi:hypothetical protein
MKRRMLGTSTLILLLSVSLFGCGSSGTGSQVNQDEPPKEEQQQNIESEKKDITNVVTEFGSKLQMVSLLAPVDILKKSMQENYGDFVSQPLLDKWINNPENAPGRLVSSPWPERIEILSIEKLTEETYEVNGEIIEVTNNGGIAAKRPITLVVKMDNNHWLIDNVTLGDYEDRNSINYQNPQYGFEFSLPESWKGYTLVAENWEGLAIDNSQGEKIIETGPTMLIRHPKWTAENPRQDIPIMIFTLAQWNSLQKEQFHIGSAPIGPSELGRNNEYVFALPARYNFAFPAGYEEVEEILKGNPLQTTEAAE